MSKPNRVKSNRRTTPRRLAAPARVAAVLAAGACKKSSETDKPKADAAPVPSR